MALREHGITLFTTKDTKFTKKSKSKNLVYF
jgi:hypothetical protein